MKKNYYYLIGYSSYEDSREIPLSNTKKFTESDIEDFLVEYINSRKNLPTKTFISRNTLAEIIPNGFVSFLCRKKGFKKLEYTSQYFRFGWPDIFDKNDWESERDGLNSITDRLVRRKNEKI
jgi:hypothetical protein